ncbi:NUDIX hydrolase [Oceanobacter mangrovi]|uniref:NUDIX hydrolase n=1 Tax=Oceanobacter mangrovi TaxID=2862510 RepID=UPI001C8E6CE6|nr:NUDIX domain-containing protein [Oceanobacter mangrovi]
MQIRNIAIGVIEDNDRIFVFEGFDPADNSVFYRPLGGGIDFGELAQEALVREFQEELNTRITIESKPRVMENRFELYGRPCHEIVFVFKASFVDPEFYSHREFTSCDEGSNSAFTAKWIPLADFRSGKLTLVPENLLQLLDSHAHWLPNH